MLSRVRTAFVLAALCVVAMSTYKAPAPCPCIRCAGSLTPRDYRTVAAHKDRDRQAMAYYVGCTVPSANLQADAFRLEPADDGPRSMSDDDAACFDYMDANPIKELPGWEDFITVHTHLHSPPQKSHTHTQDTHTHRTCTSPELSGRSCTLYLTGRRATNPPPRQQAVCGISGPTSSRRATPWTTSEHWRKC